MHPFISAAGWLGSLVLGLIIPKLLKALFTTLPSADDPPIRDGVAEQPVLRSANGFVTGLTIDDRFQLKALIGNGRLSELWQAHDLKEDKQVAVRFLLARHLTDGTLVKRFEAAAQATSLMWRGGMPPVISISKHSSTPYYVCEYLDGERLTTYAKKHHDSKSHTLAIAGIKHLAQTVERANELGIVHGGITPEDVLVDQGEWKLVDLDLACRLRKDEGFAPLYPSLSFSAPECFDTVCIGFHSDVYNLARILEYVYCGGELPTPFSMTSIEVLDKVNCSLQLKQVLRKATALDPQQRYRTAKDFIAALVLAEEPERTQAAILGVYVEEKHKIGRVLLHSSVGVLSVMLITRLLATLIATSRNVHYGLVELSDRPVVGAFHGFIGSVVWGCLIPLSFLLIWPLKIRRTAAGPLLSSVAGGLAGFIGGALCSYLSVQVTSLVILKNLGWLLPDATDHNRMHQTLINTRMFWAFPLQGMLTGLGVGLYLSLKMRTLSGTSADGLDPLPSKTHREEPFALQAALEFVAKAPWLQLILLSPVAFSWLAAKALRAHGVQFNDEWHRTLGEGFVQAVGATGLVIGFFFGIIAPTQTSSRYRVWQAPSRLIHKVKDFSSKYGI